MVIFKKNDKLHQVRLQLLLVFENFMQPSVCLHIVHRCQKIEHLYDKLNYMLNVPEKSSSDNSFFLILN